MQFCTGVDIRDVYSHSCALSDGKGSNFSFFPLTFNVVFITCPYHISLLPCQRVIRVHMQRNKSISTSTKLRSMKALVLPVAITHGCEAWTLKINEEKRIKAFENK